MPHPSSARTHTLPARPSLVQLRKQAKELLTSYRSGEHAAVIEIERFERNPDPANFALSDAQRVLARAYGFPSWTELKQHVDGLNVRAFCEAADAGDVVRVRKAAKARPELVNVQREGEFGERIALHFAVLNRDAKMTRALMELGSDARKGIWPHRSATTAHTIASERGYDEIVALIEREEERRRQEMSSPGATVSLSWGMPLWFAAMCGRHEIAELLLARGADVNAIVSACGDALSTADRTGDEKMKALLLQHGARLTVEQVPDRETAKAILEGTLPAQSLNVSEPSHTDLAEQMLWAAGRRDPDIVRMCLPHMTRERDDPWWNYVLMHATVPDSLKLILEHGVDPDVAGGGGYTMLHHLATDHVDAQTRVIRATMLLDAGASLNQRDTLLRSTPLGWACRWGRVDLVQLYLSRGADAQEPDTEPWATPSAWATKRGHQAIMELLRSHGAR